MRRLIRLFLLACLVNMTLVLEAAAGQRIWVALAAEEGPYQEAAAVLAAELGGEHLLTVRPWQALIEESAPPDLVVTVGVAAFDGLLEAFARRKEEAWARVPVMATLLPQAAFELRAPAAGRRLISAVVLDQPLSRQFNLLRLALPQARRIGVLAGPQTRPLLPVLEKEARARGLSLVVSPEVISAEQIYPALRAVIESADVLLALPEPLIYNNATLQNILLTLYRGRLPLVSFSAAHVRAGAVMALYSTPAQVTRHAATLIKSWQAGRGWPLPQPPREFAVAVNAKVAASLGLALDEAAALAEALRRLEGQP
ncbi:MAG: hypothetical protein N3C63_07600 [Rhodocyclaceae bacterium]|nr:hypothetical protein [Rhodocyclaceae bacterium]